MCNQSVRLITYKHFFYYESNEMTCANRLENLCSVFCMSKCVNVINSGMTHILLIRLVAICYRTFLFDFFINTLSVGSVQQ